MKAVFKLVFEKAPSQISSTPSSIIAFDKLDIIAIAEKIGTFETSILPYEDCCTVFTPKHPKTKPSVEEIENAQNAFDFSEMIKKAIEETEMKLIKL